jgi:NTE family protein
LAGKTIDVWAVLLGLIGPGTVSSYVARAYDRYLFGDRTLQDLPAPGRTPLFIINASNLQSGALWRFSRPYTWDYRVGKIENPTVKLSVAVAASSAFPPFLSPMILQFDENSYVPGSGMDLQRPPYTTRVYLTDGGVYDNLGLEAASKSYSTVLVSDGGAKMSDEEKPNTDWPRHTLRVLSLIDNQVRSLRKRQLMSQYLQGRAGGGSGGTYWAIRSHIRRYGLPDALRCPLAQTTMLAKLPTRLAAMDSTTQEQLINWGYAICDAAMRKRVNPALALPTGFPYPASGVGV